MAGFMPIRHLHGSPWDGNLTKWDIDPTDTTDIFFGDLVRNVSGYVARSTGAAGQVQLGVFRGCEYEDPNAPGGWRFSKTWNGVDPGYAVRAFIVPVAGLIMSVPVSGAIARGDFSPGRFTVTMGSGNTTTGLSTATIAEADTSGTGPIKLLPTEVGRDADPSTPGIGTAGTRRLHCIAALSEL